MNIAPSVPKYTLEQLQEAYELSIPRAVQILEKFGGDRRLIDKFMRRCQRS
ncbi:MULTISPECIES: hypothetical protein [Rhizobium]|uniref:Uncharacterized protein n=1 Tax=Rhizobium wenxiniae TaxID=1737357 RepID=A0A7W9YCU0_9HYPH|nr:hypothetical protein [Rhizobium wenxiniae]MBB6166205.1 hypothetical protein [Rhizobium wenxiniae]GGG23831.1 hypothetical protein GCM10010924_61740 [Rhizobium wenxiniae]